MGERSDKMASLPQGYSALLASLKQRIREARVKASLAVNTELVQLYWSIGRDILDRQDEEGWGAKVITRLSADLRQSFPEMRGFSRTNLLYMRAFAEAFPAGEIVQQVVGQIPWGHIGTLLDKLDTADQRQWYAHKTIEHGWSRAALVWWAFAATSSDLLMRRFAWISDTLGRWTRR